MGPDSRLVDEDAYFASFVNADVLASFDASTVDVADARHLPPWTYTSDDWFRFEQRAVFDRSWLCLGRAAHAANPGDFFTVTVNDDPLVVIRDSDRTRRRGSTGVQSP